MDFKLLCFFVLFFASTISCYNGDEDHPNMRSFLPFDAIKTMLLNILPPIKQLCSLIPDSTRRSGANNNNYTPLRNMNLNNNNNYASLRRMNINNDYYATLSNYNANNNDKHYSRRLNSNNLGSGLSTSAY